MPKVPDQTRTRNGKLQTPLQVQIARRRHRVTALYCARVPIHDIPDRMLEEHGVRMSLDMVKTDIKKAQEDWLREEGKGHQVARAEEMARIDALEATYQEAWLRSLRDRGYRRVRTTAEGGVEETVQTSESDGNPEFLAGIRWCIDRRCQLRGLDETKRLEVSGPDGGPVRLQLSVEDLLAVDARVVEFENAPEMLEYKENEPNPAVTDDGSTDGESTSVEDLL